MLSGEVMNPVDGGGWSNVPLSWAAQRNMFVAEAASAVRKSTS